MCGDRDTSRRLGAGARLKRARDFSRPFERGRRVMDGVMTLFAARREGGSGLRVGVAVSKRHGPAVRRNRVKRLCREAFRLAQGELPGGWDYVMVPRPGIEHSLAKLRESLRSLAAKVTRDRDDEGGDS